VGKLNSKRTKITSNLTKLKKKIDFRAFSLYFLADYVQGGYFYKVLILKELRQITVIGMGLLGASITLAVSRSLPAVKTVGFSHRPSTRSKARKLGVAQEIARNIEAAVADADIVILATPICTFEKIFARIANSLPAGCIVTDVGSTKVLPHKWAKELLPSTVQYVGSHPIAGSEQRGVEFARDDLFAGTDCILTVTSHTDINSVKMLKHFWEALGSRVMIMAPTKHDKVVANISHLPHVTAAALLNANSNASLKMAGKGFIDTSRVASGPANVWTDILVTNAGNICESIDRLGGELKKMRTAIKNKDQKRIERLLKAARRKRAAMIHYKLKEKDIIS
jgi:prephenate dehydrogenase